VKDRLKAQVRLPQGRIEVRTYEWGKHETNVFNVPVYHVSRLLTRMRHKQIIHWRLPNERQTRSVSQFSVVPAHYPITVEASAGEATFITCSFEPDYFERLVEVGEWTNELTATFMSVHNPFVEAVLDRLAQEILDLQPDSDRLLGSLVTLLTVELAHIIKLGDPSLRRSGKLANWQLDRLRARVEGAHRGAAVSLAELAASCSISPRHLARGFKAATGTTIHTYIRGVRLERAKALLAVEGISLKEISDEVGFANASHFAAEFRQRIGCTPSEYRARQRND
jgi:AraC family transcriptional regulator